MVLDPLSALSVTSAALQLTSFVGSLIREGNQIYNSADGISAEHSEFVKIAEKLASLSGLLDESASSFPRDGKLSVEEKELKLASAECKIEAQRFLEVLDNLIVSDPHRRWNTFRQAFKSVWHKDELELMQKKLDTLRQQMVASLLVVMRYAASSPGDLLD